MSAEEGRGGRGGDGCWLLLLVVAAPRGWYALHGYFCPTANVRRVVTRIIRTGLKALDLRPRYSNPRPSCQVLRRACQQVAQCSHHESKRSPAREYFLFSYPATREQTIVPQV